LYKTGYLVQASFQINLGQKDIALLEKIKAFFGGVGKVKFLKEKERSRFL
jgi:hypothetical protein